MEVAFEERIAGSNLRGAAGKVREAARETIERALHPFEPPVGDKPVLGHNPGKERAKAGRQEGPVVVKDPVSVRRERLEGDLGVAFEAPREEMIVGDVHDDSRHPSRSHPATASLPDGVAIGVGVDCAMHADAGRERRGGETIEPSFDKITRHTAGEKDGRFGGQKSVGEMVHRAGLCVSSKRRV